MDIKSCLIYCHCCLVILIFHTGSVSTLNREFFIVTVNPFVSILDIDNETKYSVEDLVPIIAKVSSQFDHIAIEGEEKIPFNSSSKYLVAKAAAKLNFLSAQKQNKTSQSVSVWLIEKAQFTLDIEEVFSARINELKKFVNDVNKIFGETVKTLLFDYSSRAFLNFDVLLNHLKTARNILGGLVKIGAVFNPSHCLEETNGNRSLLFAQLFQTHSELILFNLHKSLVTRSGDIVEVIGDDAVGDFETIRKECLQGLNETQLGIFAGTPDTTPNGVTNYARIVQYWESISNWSEKFKAIAIMKGAFDFISRTPHSNMNKFSTSGWWMLDENSSYRNTSDFVFREKRTFEKHLRTLQKQLVSNSGGLIDNIEFSRKQFATLLRPPANITLLSEQQWEYFLQIVTTRFGTIAAGTDIFESEGKFTNYQNLIRAAVTWNKRSLRDKEKNISIVVLASIVGFNEEKFNLLQETSALANSESPNTVSNILINLPNVDTINSNFNSNSSSIVSSLENLLKNCSSFCNVGLGFPLEQCSDHRIIALMKRLDFLTKFSFTGFRGTQLYLPVAVERSVSLHTTLFESCSKMVTMEINHKIKMSDISLVTWWPALDNEGREITSQMVLYYKLMNEWAMRKNTSVIVSRTFDFEIRGKHKKSKSNEFGWWKLISNNSSSNSLNDYVFVERQTGKLFPLVVNKTKPLEQTEQLPSSAVAVATGIVLILVPCVSFIVIWYLRQSRIGHILTKKDIEYFLDQSNYDSSKFEIPREQFEINKSKQLGNGHFGIVYAAKLKSIDLEVAVKTVKLDFKKRRAALLSLISEIKLLVHFGDHENVVRMVGACTSQIRRGELYMFLELCSNGSLKSYLDELDKLNLQPSQDNLITQNQMVENDFPRWSLEICRGMEYISSKNVVHVDLATRNVLLDSNNKVKIADFGLSRRLREYEIYLKSSMNEPLSWQWMAPESLKWLTFSEKTDVWAFGVTLWEIYSFGKQPFPTADWDDNFIRSLENGRRLLQPDHAARRVYKIMRDCWQTKPELRPSFANLIKVFSEQ